jgi:hypothetical protein
MKNLMILFFSISIQTAHAWTLDSSDSAYGGDYTVYNIRCNNGNRTHIYKDRNTGVWKTGGMTGGFYEGSSKDLKYVAKRLCGE